MSLQIIYGRAGSGKTTACFNLLKELLNTEVLFIVPEQISLRTETEIINNFAENKVDVLSFERLAQRVFAQVGPVGNQYMDTALKHMLVQRILMALDRKLLYLSSAHQTEDFSGVLVETINELKRY
ncbi:MAG: helicase-exonuclease AddAB subunit AddB, partial [Clostridiaceae bacterium]|nr:helicase-exonuclease AddAB subunit AddB [Clostridiaceae bacterium]